MYQVFRNYSSCYPAPNPVLLQLSGTSDSDEIVQLEPAANPATQSCGVQTRNVRVNTDSYHYASYVSKLYILQLFFLLAAIFYDLVGL